MEFDAALCIVSRFSLGLLFALERREFVEHVAECSGVVGDLATTSTIFRGIMWFLVSDLIVIVLLIAFPDIVLYLPSLMD